MATNSPSPPASLTRFPNNSHLQIYTKPRSKLNRKFYTGSEKEAEKTQTPKSEFEVQESMQFEWKCGGQFTKCVTVCVCARCLQHIERRDGNGNGITAQDVSLELLGSRSPEDNVGHPRQVITVGNVSVRYILETSCLQQRPTVHIQGSGWHLGCLHVDEKRLHVHNFHLIHL